MLDFLYFYQKYRYAKLSSADPGEAWTALVYILSLNVKTTARILGLRGLKFGFKWTQTSLF